MPSTYSSTAYLATVQLNGVDKRTMTTTNPAAASTATKGTPTSSLVPGGAIYYIKPETAIPTGAGSQIALNPVGTAAGVGWALIPSSNAVVQLPADGFTMTAFNTATIVLRANRDNNALSGNLTATFTVIFFRANSNATSFPDEIARGALTGATITTTLTDFTITVTSSNGAIFDPGDVLWMEIHVNTTSAAAVNSTPSYTTNISAGCRVTLGFSYTKQINRSLSDSVAVSDALLRAYVGQRALADSVPLTGDLLSRAFVGYRALSESMPVSDALTRAFTGSRSLADSVPVSDSLARTVVTARTLTDALPVADSVARQYTARRTIQDSVPVADALQRLFVANRALVDALSPVADALTRSFTGNRALVDSVSVGDFISRQTTYRRAILDALATGGGGTTIIRRKRVTIFDKA